QEAGRLRQDSQGRDAAERRPRGPRDDQREHPRPTSSPRSTSAAAPTTSSSRAPCPRGRSPTSTCGGGCSPPRRCATGPRAGTMTMPNSVHICKVLLSLLLDRLMLKGDLVSWDSATFDTVNMATEYQPVSSVCNPVRPGHVSFPEMRTLADHVSLCLKMGGR